MIRLPWFAKLEYGIDPDALSVADAVRMSTAIPYYYMPFKLRSALTGQESYMVDGGLNSAFPADIFDRTDGQPSRWPTFYIALQPVLRPAQPAQPPNGPFGYTRALVLTGLDGRDNAQLDTPASAGRTIAVDTTYVSPLDFGIGQERREELYRQGYAAAETFLAGFTKR
jgi:NTE family protein